MPLLNSDPNLDAIQAEAEKSSTSVDGQQAERTANQRPTASEKAEPTVQDAVQRVVDSHRKADKSQTKTDQERSQADDDVNAQTDSQSGTGGDDGEEQETSQGTSGSGSGEGTGEEEEEADGEGSGSGSGSGEGTGEQEAADVNKDKTLTQEQKDAKLPFHNHPRFKELTTENREMRRFIQRVNADIEQRQKLGITPDLYKQAMDLGALSIKDPKKFYEVVGQMQGEYEVNAGIRLPNDLQKKVDDGKMDEADAKEIAQLRVKAQAGERGVKSAAEQQEAVRVQQVTEGLNAIELVIRKADPTFKPKVNGGPNGIYEFALQGFLVEQAKTPPRNGLEAQRLFEKCYNDVKASFAAFLPRKPASRVPNRNASSFSSTAARRAETNGEPKSAHDAVNQMLKSRGISVRVGRHQDE